ncbi:HvfC family RiPP maturation protein [Methylococcus mesophilus]|uniref:HvfC family RiPP maturation protein n=1 Tax=Methylococcus mesophilus TaxID=2993564 RepID=UPI00224AAF4F|nr:putative DNA-binding domain-containing protein [Methylococcus mesophilus]UZR27604.1 putative DNA-binding domain-containing protein [Methylococcus mesophilus]
MAETEFAFQRLQREFASHIRDPARYPAPAGVPSERIAIYRELLYNNIESFVGNGFPVVKRILGEERWNSLVRDFFARHVCTTPYFSEICEEFLAYLEEERNLGGDDPPFLFELAHYEWVELALAIHPAEAFLRSAGLPPNWPERRVEISPLAWHLGYRYPVHRIDPDFIPDSPPETPSFLLVYRGRDERVRFLESPPLLHRLFELFDEARSAVLGRHIERLAAETGGDSMVLNRQVEPVLADLDERGILRFV